jgi:hypothetical protein
LENLTHTGPARDYTYAIVPESRIMNLTETAVSQSRTWNDFHDGNVIEDESRACHHACRLSMPPPHSDTPVRFFPRFLPGLAKKNTVIVALGDGRARVTRPMVVLLVAAFLSLAGGSQVFAGNNEWQEELFSLVLPDGFTIDKRTPVEDFDIYTIEKAKKPYVIIYVGNHPDFPKREKTETEDVVLFTANDIKIYSIFASDGLISHEMLIRIKDGVLRGQQYIHAWTVSPPKGSLSRADKIFFSQADKILFSIKTNILEAKKDDSFDDESMKEICQSICKAPR